MKNHLLYGAVLAALTLSQTAPALAQSAGMDNRFYMTQNGKRMTADDFDSWMKSRGVRIAGGKPATLSTATVAPTMLAQASPPPASNAPVTRSTIELPSVDLTAGAPATTTNDSGTTTTINTFKPAVIAEPGKAAETVMAPRQPSDVTTSLIQSIQEKQANGANPTAQTTASARNLPLSTPKPAAQMDREAKAAKTRNQAQATAAQPAARSATIGEVLGASRPVVINPNQTVKGQPRKTARREPEIYVQPKFTEEDRSVQVRETISTGSDSGNVTIYRAWMDNGGDSTLSNQTSITQNQNAENFTPPVSRVTLNPVQSFPQIREVPATVYAAPVPQPAIREVPAPVAYVAPQPAYVNVPVSQPVYVPPPAQPAYVAIAQPQPQTYTQPARTHVQIAPRQYAEPARPAYASTGPVNNPHVLRTPHPVQTQPMAVSAPTLVPVPQIPAIRQATVTRPVAVQQTVAIPARDAQFYSY